MTSETNHMLELSLPPLPLGVIAMTGWQVISVLGNDAKSFLSGLLTNEIKKLQPGDNNSSLILTAKGRIQREIQVVAFPDGLRLLAPPGEGQAVCDFLDFYHIMEDLRFTLDESTHKPLLLIGDNVPDWTTEHLSVAWPEAGKGIEVDLAGLGAATNGPDGWLSRTERMNAPAAWLWIPTEHHQACHEAIQAMGVVAVSDEEWNTQSAWYGWLTNTKTISELLVHEAGLQESHVSYTKGCFVGQEVVARTQHRGKATKGIFIVKFDGDEALEVATEIADAEGKVQGQILGALTLPNQDKGYHALLKLKAIEESAHLFVQDSRLQLIKLVPAEGASS